MIGVLRWFRDDTVFVPGASASRVAVAGAGPKPNQSVGLASLPLLAFGMWLLAWMAISAGPWNFADFDNGFSGKVNAVRAGFPLAILGLGLVLLARNHPRSRSWVEKGMWGYGIVALLACTGAADWFEQAYWGFAFLGALVTMELVLRSPSPMLSLTWLNILSWIATTIALIGMLLLARDVLLDPAAEGSGYGMIVRFQNAHGYLISRETGLSRMAVIPALIGLAFLLSGKIWQRALGGAVFLAAASIIWIMQSRGALFAFLGGFLFVLFAGRKVRGPYMLLAMFGAMFVLYLVLPSDQVQEIWQHATREQGTEGFATQSGRTEIWVEMINRWTESPVFGFGPQADRLFHVNAQNAVIYALICGGLVGAGFFVTALVSAIRALIRMTARGGSLPGPERKMLQITGGLLVFYLLRSIPENNAALFSVDLLLQYGAMIYLCELQRRVDCGEFAQLAATSVRIPRLDLAAKA